MADRRWRWDANSKRFRDTKTGRYIGERRAVQLRDEYVDRRSASMRAFVDRELAGADPNDRPAWGMAVSRVNRLGWRRIENTLIAEYIYGRGGIEAMTAADRTHLQTLLTEQRRYWRAFMREARTGELSTEQIGARSQMYHHASTGFYERARARSWEIELPAYPGDGNTVCLSRCRCRWVIRRRKDRIEATWEATVNPCPDCEQNANTWAPYTVRLTEEGPVYDP